MKLHQNQNAFRVLLEQMHARSGYRMDVLEKDYYVVLMLKELAEKQEKGLPARLLKNPLSNLYLINSSKTSR